jgi:PhnB protein
MAKKRTAKRKVTKRKVVAKRSARQGRGARAKVSPVPAGFSSLTAYLTVNGAGQAIEFYKKAFGAKEINRHNTPDGKVLNATLRIGDSNIMLADEFPGSITKSPSALGASTVTIHVYSKDVDKLWSQAVAAGAQVAMPLENQFWGERYGQVIDPFGHRWSVSMQVKMSPEEMAEKRKAAMSMFEAGEHPGREETLLPTTS